MSISLAHKILSSRKERNLTQEDLAKMLNYSLHAVHRWETGKVKKIPMVAIEGIARATGKPISYFLEDSSSRVYDSGSETTIIRKSHSPYNQVPIYDSMAVARRDFSKPVDHLPTSQKGDLFAVKMDRLIYTCDPNGKINHNDFVLVIDGKSVLFRQYKEVGGQKMLQDGDDIDILGRNEIIGRVTSKTQDFN